MPLGLIARQIADDDRDGYILLVALNAALHVSPKPWGFVSPSDMYDTLSAGNGEEEGGGDWTFRRVGNLTAWAA